MAAERANKSPALVLPPTVLAGDLRHLPTGRGGCRSCCRGHSPQDSEWAGYGGASHPGRGVTHGGLAV